tara:strand:- start:283 stop:693 length:411 start_codon:yes stop_codon:yes gene_type:complete
MTKSLIAAFIFASLIFIIVDGLWLSFAIKLLYKPALGSLLNEKPIIWATILFYLVYTLGLFIIIIKPAIISDSIFQAFWTGIIFGLVAYGTYNLTNMAAIKNWSSDIVFIDMVWGSLLTGFTASTSVYLTKIFFSN